MEQMPSIQFIKSDKRSDAIHIGSFSMSYTEIITCDMEEQSKCKKHNNNVYISFGAQKRVNSAVYKVKRVEVGTQHNGRFKITIK